MLSQISLCFKDSDSIFLVIEFKTRSWQWRGKKLKIMKDMLEMYAQHMFADD